MATTPTPTTTPRPTTYRPPAPAAKPKKNNGPLIGMIALGVLALVGLGGAGALFSQQGGLKAELATHRDAATNAAATLNVAIDTNAPIDWAALWPRINTTITTIRNESERQTVRITEMEQELEVAQGLQATLQKAQTDGQRSAQQVTELTAQLDALKASSTEQITKLRADLESANQLAEERAAALAAAAVAAPATTTDADAPAAEGEVAAADTAAAPAEGEAVEEAAPAEAAQNLSFTFPARSELLDAATYDAGNQSLVIRLRDGTDLTYQNVPQELYEQLTTIPSYEPFYRIRIMGNYPVTPDDKSAVRAHNQRR